MSSLRTPGPAFLMLALFAAPALAQTVPVAPFNGIQLEGGGHVTVRYGAAQQVRIVAGSTAYTRIATDASGKLRIDACDRDCPDHYDLQVDITTPRIEGLAVSGGGEIVSQDGFPAPQKLALGIEGGGSVDARALDARSVSAAVDGGGEIRLRASGKLNAAVNGGGLIRYWGHPVVTSAINGGGDVEGAN